MKKLSKEGNNNSPADDIDSLPPLSLMKPQSEQLKRE